MKKQTILECKKVTKTFDQKKGPILKEVSFTLNAGEVFLLEAPNGSGKTTLLRILSGILAPDSGEIVFCGHSYSYQTTEARGDIGFSPNEDRSFFQNASARENLKFFAQLYGLSATALDNQILEYSKAFECESFLDDPIQNLSSGYRKRFSLIRTFLHQPKLLLMDEPFAPLDRDFRKYFLSYLENWVKTHQAAAVVCSHTDTVNAFLKKSAADHTLETPKPNLEVTL